MTLTPERIAETEKSVADRPKDLHYLTPDYLAELCRLARLGLRVEGAPTTHAKLTPAAWHGPTWLKYEPLPNEWGGKRVALVVLDD